MTCICICMCIYGIGMRIHCIHVCLCVYVYVDAATEAELECNFDALNWKNLSFTRQARKGTNGVSTNGVTANVMLFDKGTFLVLLLICFSSSQTCQGVPFSPIFQNSLLLQRPR